MNIKNLAFIILSVILFSSCASTIPKPEFTKQIPPESKITASDDTNLSIDTAPGVSLLEDEKARITDKIKQKINERKASVNQNASPKSYDINILMTKYDKGNAFARAMLAGLGQIHIDGEVTVIEMPEKNLVGNFTISKTFAWGGIYGGFTSIEVIETTFADGIAATLTGQNEEQNK